MKSFLLLPTGIADRPVAALDDRTPMQAANTPHLDRLAREGRVGLVRQVPEGLRTASDVAVLSVLGYDPRRWSAGRGGLEAAGLGIELGADDVAFRLNFVSTFQGNLVDFSAGHIGGVEARLLVEALQAQLGDERVSFRPGLGYRNLLVMRGGRELEIETTPPQDVKGDAIVDHLPRGRDAGPLRELLERAAVVLSEHDINRVRVDLGENPADRVWPWGRGERCEIEPFVLRTGASLGVVAAVPLVRGVAGLMGAEVPTVPGATGHWDTDYAAKLRAALDLLERHDVVVLHVAAANEACHDADVRLKVKVVEDLDRFVAGPLRTAIEKRGDTRLLLTTDHMTSSAGSDESTTHVPFLFWGPGVEPVRARRFTEVDAEAGELTVDAGHRMMEFLRAGAEVPR